MYVIKNKIYKFYFEIIKCESLVANIVIDASLIFEVIIKCFMFT